MEENRLDKKADGKWRFEIDDSDAKFNFGELNQIGNVPFSHVLSNTDLFNNYPFLAEINVKLTDFSQKTNKNGAYSQNSISLNRNLNEETLKTTLLHEIQHIVQDYEGFEKGSNLKSVRNEVLKKGRCKTSEFSKKKPEKIWRKFYK